MAMLIRFYDIILEGGILVLLIVTPLAFGSVIPGAITFLESISGLLLLVWLAKAFSKRKAAPRKTPIAEQPLQQRSMLLMLLMISLFLGWIFLQTLPLPTLFVKFMSPATYQAYADGAALIRIPLPSHVPLSVCRQATEVEFFKYIAYAIIFFLVLATIRTRQQINRMAYSIMAVGLLEACYGLFQFISGSHLVYFYKTDAWAHGTFINKNHLAGYLEMVILLGFGALFTRFEPSGNKSSFAPSFVDALREQYPKAFLWLLGLLVLIFAHLLSGSRGGIVSFGCGVIGFAILAYTRRLLRRWMIVLLIFLPLTLGSVMLMYAEALLPRVETLLQAHKDLSLQERVELWKGAWWIFRDYPVAGSGLGTFAHLAERYQGFPSNFHYNYPENDYVQMLAETGIIGTIVIFIAGILFLAHILIVWKQRHSRWVVAMTAGQLCALLSLAIHSCTDFNLHIPSNALLFTVIAALSYATVHTQRQRSERMQQAIPATPQPAPARTLRWHLLIPIGMLVCLYLLRVGQSYYAFLHYPSLAQKTDAQPAAAVVIPGHAETIQRLLTAIRHDRHNPNYHFALGSYLYRHYAARQDLQTADKLQGFQEAEQWFQQALLLDPANAQYYYDLGRLSLSRGDCRSWQMLPSLDSVTISEPPQYLEACPAMSYFLAALQNAPQDLFLRRAVGQWLYTYNRQAAHRLVRELMNNDRRTIHNFPVALEFAKFLYDIQMDYESDRELSYVTRKVLQQCEADSFLSESSALREVELGNDDGSAEWNVRLTSENFRVKKVICLPEHLAPYQTVALKIYLNYSGPTNFLIHLKIDDHLLEIPAYTIPRLPQWREIPVDKTILEGKSRISVYIRVVGPLDSGAALHIWGDEHTPTTRSLSNFDRIKDLAFDDGNQTGEYMIRLVLRVNSPPQSPSLP